MKIGYVQVGAPWHGVTRHGRLLAAEARERADLIVLECEVELSGNRREDRLSRESSRHQRPGRTRRESLLAFQ